MLNSITRFIKYNNAALLILAAIFFLGTAALATETGQTVLGQKETIVEGVDNTLLLEADLEILDMDFKIERIESDDKYYYITYTFIDLVRNNNVWEYQMQEKIRRISKKLKKDLGLYLAEELGEEYEARIKDLKSAQTKEQAVGTSKRVEITGYSGLIGTALDLTGRVFPNYEPVTILELPSPTLPVTLAVKLTQTGDAVESIGEPDGLTQVYLEYVSENDPDGDNVFGVVDNCPDISNPDQVDSDGDGLGDACDSTDDSQQTRDDNEQAADSSIATGSEELIIGGNDAVTATGTEEDNIMGESVFTEEPVTDPAEDVIIEPGVEIIELPAEDETASATS